METCTPGSGEAACRPTAVMRQGGGSPSYDTVCPGRERSATEYILKAGDINDQRAATELFYRQVFGEGGTDPKGMMRLMEAMDGPVPGVRDYRLRYRTQAELFEYIEDNGADVVVPDGRVFEILASGTVTARARRELSLHSVALNRSQMEAAEDAGLVERLSKKGLEDVFVLTDVSRYNSRTGIEIE